MKIRQQVLTLKCNWSSLKICGALWDNASHPCLFLLFDVPTLGALEDLGLIIFALQEELVITPPPGVYITAYLHLNNFFQM